MKTPITTSGSRRTAGRPTAKDKRPGADPWQALARSLARAAWEASRVGTPPAEPFPLALALTVTPGARWRVEAAPPLESQVRRAVREAGARRDVFRPGRVWCFRCESSACEHAAPPSPGKVFGGYAPTGLPEWTDFTEVLLALRHPGVERAFGGGRSALTAAEVPAQRLRERQLEAFGRDSMTYDIIAEVVFGPVEVGRRVGPGEPVRAAFTLQAVETRDAQGLVRLHGNLLGRLEDGTEALDALGDGGHTRILEIVRTARRRIAALSPRPARGAPACAPAADVRARAAAAVHEAARSLDRLGRQRGRRTAHAENRGLSRRPTGSALEDTRGAAPESFLRDARRDTVIVLGPRERVHVFSPDGRHVTTLHLDPDTVRRRRSRERWEPLAAADRQRFQAVLGEGR